MVKHSHDKFAVGGSHLHPAQLKLARLVYHAYSVFCSAFPHKLIEVSEYIDGIDSKSVDTLHVYFRQDIMSDFLITFQYAPESGDLVVSSDMVIAGDDNDHIVLGSFEELNEYVASAIETLKNLNFAG